ncbi:MAG: OpgC domain-containing protein [Chloroflexota bacterium]|nr:OpgC domain-containing protein [Chloroflexota bacterium]
MEPVQRDPAPIAAPQFKKRGLPTPGDLWRAITINWGYPDEKRDLRLDMLRGFAVFVMVVDHFGGASWLYLITGNNRFFTSGAEAFVLISGMVVGLVYGNIVRRDGFRAAAVKALQRAWTLYKLTVVMTLLFATVSDLFTLPWAKGVDLGNPFEFIFNVLILHETYYLADIPMMYTVLMALAPVGLWLLYKQHTWLLVLASSLIWVGYQVINTEQIFIWPTIGNTTFHPAAWQLIFFWAMAIGYHRVAIWERLGELPSLAYFSFSALLFFWLLHLYTAEFNTLSRLYPGIDMNAYVAELFSKSAVAPGRILATAIVFQFAYLLLTYFWKPFSKLMGWIFVPLGQNSLYSYTMHVVVIALFYMALPHLPVDVTSQGMINTGLQLATLLLLWVMIRRSFLFNIVPR